MKSKVLPNATPKSDAEYEQEADRLSSEIRVMLDNARRTSDRAKEIGKENRILCEQLSEQLLGSKATRNHQSHDYQTLQREFELQLKRQRELHTTELEILELRLRLHISEELRRLKTPAQ